MGSLETDRLARLLSPLTPLSTRRGSMMPETLKRSCSASTLQLVRRDLPSPRLSRGSLTLMPRSTLLLCLLLHLTPLPCSTSPHTPALPWESTSETMECTLSSSSTTCPSRLWPTDKCPCC